MALYGLAWMDEDGVFHGDLARREPLLQHSPFDLWAIEPGDPPRVHLGPRSARFDIADLFDIARRTVASQRNRRRSGVDAAGKPYRLFAMASYDDADVARMAVLVVGDTAPYVAAHRSFVASLALVCAAVAAAGLAVGAWLARRSLRPVAETFRMRHRFLAGAAHELRGPVAGLRAVCESAAAGDEPAEAALGRIGAIVSRTGDVVENLLLFARLEADRTEFRPRQLRLDLLVEATLPEDALVDSATRHAEHGERVRLDAEPVLVEGDDRLLRVAVANLVRNALRYGYDGRGTSDGPRGRDSAVVTVRVRASSVVVEDDGPGFAAEVLEHAGEPFLPGRRGVGLGLALVRMIAEVHGGDLVVQNRPEGGARAIFRISSSAVSRLSGSGC